MQCGLLFEFFRMFGLKNFINADDNRKSNKILSGPVELKLSDDTLVETNFSHAAFKHLIVKEKLKLIETPQNLLLSFFKLKCYIHKVRNSMKLYLFEDLIQNIKSDCDDVFQLCFYDHLFGPNNDSKIRS